jgi:Sec-independent protein translocase protein TatA
MAVNHSIVIEYLKAFVSWPFITLVIVVIVMWKLGETIRQLISRIRNVKGAGVEASFDAIEAVKKEVETKQLEIAELPEGEEKAKRIAELEKEVQVLQQYLNAFATNRVRRVPATNEGFLPYPPQ